MAFVSILVLLFAALFATWPYKIYCNYLVARKTGLRIIISPLTPFELPWQVSPSLFGSLVKRQRWFRALDQTCAWQDKNKLHEELGSCFLLVSPGMNMLCTNDPIAFEQVFKKMKEFPKPEVFKTLDFFGPSIMTVNDEPWARHRKLTTPCFNERISMFVWDESLRQTNDMLEDWLAKPEAKSNTVIQDSGTVALHVIAAAAFGEQRDFREGVNKLTPNHKLSFRDSLKTVLRNPVTAAVAGGMPWLKKSAFQSVLSARVRKVQLALKEFKSYMDEAIARERKSIDTNSSTSGKKPNLLNALVRASDDIKAEGAKTSLPMTDDELTGNMFMFAFAGHETTATAISYALALLAVHPNIQDWVAEELVEVFGNAETMEYAKIHPRLKRTLAVMYETVRIFGVPPPWRSVAVEHPAIMISNPTDTPSTKTLVVPANTQVSLNVFACHTAPQNFTDGLSWNPKRWIRASPPSSNLADEQFLSNNKAFFGWGSGPRVCPGQKFAHVEFTAVLATLLTRHKVVPALKGEGNGDAARERILELVAGSTASMVVAIKEPEELWVKLVER
jgi:cytochrome P450